MASTQAADFEQLIARVARELAHRDLPFMVIGGQAVLLHGEPRLTQDIDITLGVGPDRIAEVLAACHALDCKPLPDEPETFARRTFVLPAMDPATSIRIDFIFSTLPYEREAIEQADLLTVGGTSVPYARAEDLILHKLFAGRPRDLEDVRGIVARKGDRIDWVYVERWAREFSVVEGRENLPSQVRQIRADFESQSST